MNRPDTRPPWLRYWRHLRDRNLVTAAFPTPAWIAAFEAGEVADVIANDDDRGA